MPEQASRPRFLDRLLGRTAAAPEGTALYNAVVARGRAPHWYVEGGVPDTMEGRFDTIASVLAIVLLRLEVEPEAASASAWVTERFIADMDEQLRQIGIGDVVVGKQVGKLMGLLGGRLGAYRAALAGDGDFGDALVRNLYRGERPAAAALAHVEDRLLALRAALAQTPLDALLAGRLPA